MTTFGRLRSPLAAFLHDLAMVAVAWFGAYLLRFNLEVPPQQYLATAVAMLPLVLLTQAGMFWYFGLYRGVWRFASIPDLVRILGAVVVGVALTAVVAFLYTRMEGVPRSILPIHAALLVLLLGGPRFLYRWLKDHKLYLPRGESVLIVGAGKAGEMLVRDLHRDRRSSYNPVAFVDDDASKQGRDIRGIAVVGSCDEIPALVDEYHIKLVLIALPSATSRQIRRVVEICEQCGVPFRTLPRMDDLASGQVTLKELRDVSIEDLLGREKVTLDWDAITRGMAGRSVLVTGGGGSIGSELCRQIARLRPKKLVVLERSEFNLYQIDLSLRRDFPDINLVSVLGDVGDPGLVDKVLSAHDPVIVFHAAAYKHVPMLEYQACAAVRNNVLGTRNIAQRALMHGCEAFVLISTDKAVNPTNVMGATKRSAEIICQELNAAGKTRFITVRFGNVLGSAGSVIPLFQQQIAQGGPVTVTHPDITRYFMTIPEACQLILQACAIGKGGEIFVLDMGEPVRIAYLAEQLILLSGKKPDEDIEIAYTGLRPGEKLHEELFHESERLVGTSHPKIALAAARAADAEVLYKQLEIFDHGCRSGDEAGVRQALTRLVPEFVASQVPETGERLKIATVHPLRGGPNAQS